MLKSFLLLLFLAPVPQEPQEDFLEPGKIQKLFDEIVPLVEKETGKKFTKVPGIRIVTRAEVREILTDELIPQMKMMFPDSTEKEVRDQASSSARMYTRILLGKYAVKKGEIVILPDNFLELGTKLKDSGINSRKRLRVILMHEAVHALDEQRYGIVSGFSRARTMEELEILNALVEGHAQYVTRRIHVREKREKEFLDFEKSISAIPPDMDEGEKLLAKILSANIITAYVDGLRFFEELKKEGKKDFVDRVFQSPPKSIRVIYHPELYFHPEKAPKLRDLTALWDAMKKKYGKEWKSTIRKLNQAQLRGSIGGLLPKEEEDELLGSYLGGEVLIFQPQDSGIDKMIVLGVLEMESSGAANRAYDLMLKLHKAKDEKMKEGAIRITRSDYRKQKAPNSDRSIAVEKWISVQGMSVFVRDTMTVAGPFFIEHLSSGREDGKDGGVKPVIEDLQEICEFLKKKE